MKNPDRVFLDVMSYADAVIPSPESFDSQADLQRYLQRTDRKSKLSGDALNLMTNSRSAQKLIDEGVKKVERRGQRIKILPKSSFDPFRTRVLQQELRRKPKSRLPDERRTVKSKGKLLSVNKEGFKRWKKDPAQFDLRGIDTKTHSAIRSFLQEKRLKARGQGRRVFNDRNITQFVVKQDKLNRPFAQNIITGRRVPKTTYSRFGTLKKLERKGRIR